MCNPDCKPDANTIFSKQFDLAWEHFKFHAEQRTRMFHFFLLVVALLLNAFSLLVRSEDAGYQAHAFILLCLGGLLSTIFLSLDVRNTQLLESSEGLLRKIEKDTLYTDWREEISGEEVKLGILSREAVLKKYLQDKKQTCGALTWININRIKHKFAVRSIEIIAIVGFWIGAYETAPPVIIVPLLGLEIGRWILIGIGVLCVSWSFLSMRTPRRHRKWEREALKAADAEKSVGGTGSS